MEATIVGVVDDVRYVVRGHATMPEIYYSSPSCKAGSWCRW